jgi:hypothetical protein
MTLILEIRQKLEVGNTSNLQLQPPISSSVSRPSRSADEFVTRDLAIENFDDARHAAREFLVVRDHQHRLALTHHLRE